MPESDWFAESLQRQGEEVERRIASSDIVQQVKDLVHSELHKEDFDAEFTLGFISRTYSSVVMDKLTAEPICTCADSVALDLRKAKMPDTVQLLTVGKDRVSE